jgi:hypothetical protein
MKMDILDIMRKSEQARLSTNILAQVLSVFLLAKKKEKKREVNGGIVPTHDTVDYRFLAITLTLYTRMPSTKRDTAILMQFRRRYSKPLLARIISNH